MDMLTTAQSETSDPPTSTATPNCTSSPGWAGGPTPCGLPASPTTTPSGPVPVRVNLSASQARAAGLMTSGTFGPTGTGSSASVALTSSLGNRLTARLAGRGSTLYSLTWKVGATPSGRSYFLLRGSVRRTSDTACSGWPTPQHRMKGGGEYQDPEKARARLKSGHQVNLQDLAKAVLAGWPTPMAGSLGRPDTPERKGYNAAGNNDASRKTVALLTGWPTPKAEDAESTGFSAKRLAAGKIPDNLHSASKLAGWATPATRDYRTPNHKAWAERGGGKKGEQLNNQVAHTIPGASLNGLPAQTDGTGILNPVFSLWLQGYPATWAACAPQGTRSTPLRRPSSSALPLTLSGLLDLLKQALDDNAAARRTT